MTRFVNSDAAYCANQVAHFSLAAAPDPGLLPRVLEVFAKRGLVPDHFFGRIDRTPEPRLDLDIRASGLTPELAAHMARSLGQIVGVEQVLLADHGDG